MGLKVIRSREELITASPASSFPAMSRATTPGSTVQRKRSRNVGAVYPGKVAIRRAGEAARALGITIGGIEIGPDGTIKVLDRGTAFSQPKDEYEEWSAAGKLA